MVYKKKMTKKTFAKKGRRFSKRIINKKNSLISLIKKVSLKTVETKHTHSIFENGQLYHNTPVINLNHLRTTQAVTSDDTGTENFAMRVGDEVILRGLSYKFWFANKLDRPNVTYKIVFFQYQASATPTAPDPYYAAGTTNYLIRDLNTEKFKVLKIVRFSLQNNAQRITSENNFIGAEGHRSVSVWIPLKNRKCKYENGTGTPKFLDIGYNIVCYDSYGTLLTDNISSFAVNRKLYFKDA